MFTPDDSLDTKFTLESQRTGVVDEPPFHILMLGDWSGNSGNAKRAIAKPIEIDRDNFERVMEHLGVAVTLGEAAALEFRDIDDFHPDSIYRTVPVFSELRDLRQRLKSESTFRQAAREVRAWSESAEEPAAPERIDQPKVPTATVGLLDSILADPAGGSARTSHISSDLNTLISDLVRPHIVGIDEDEQSAMVAAVDAAASGLMRDILRNHRFRELEAAWRGLFLLTRRVETDSDLKIFICDVAKDDLIADLSGTTDLGNTSTNQMLMAPITGEPWAVVCGNYAFEPTVADIAALIRISQIAAKANAPFISHMRPEVFGMSTIADAADSKFEVSDKTPAGKLWMTIRGLPESEFLGFVTPRFLARAPYGGDTDPAETFSFEEFIGDAVSDPYVWSNGCFLAAVLLGQSFSARGWEMMDGLVTDVEGLPTHVFQRSGQTIFQAAVEAQLSEEACERLSNNGFMPLAAFKNTDRVRLVRFRSASESGHSIRGRWSD